MVNGLYSYSTFLVFQLLKVLLHHKSAFICSHTHSHTNSKVASLQRASLLFRNSYTHIHTPMAQSSGVIWGLVSCPRTLWHVDLGNRGSNHRPSEWYDLPYFLSHSHPNVIQNKIKCTTLEFCHYKKLKNYVLCYSCTAEIIYQLNKGLTDSKGISNYFENWNCRLVLLQKW